MTDPGVLLKDFGQKRSIETIIQHVESEKDVHHYLTSTFSTGCMLCPTSLTYMLICDLAVSWGAPNVSSVKSTTWGCPWSFSVTSNRHDEGSCENKKSLTLNTRSVLRSSIKKEEMNFLLAEFASRKRIGGQERFSPARIRGAYRLSSSIRAQPSWLLLNVMLSCVSTKSSNVNSQ